MRLALTDFCWLSFTWRRPKIGWWATDLGCGQLSIYLQTVKWAFNDGFFAEVFFLPALEWIVRRHGTMEIALVIGIFFSCDTWVRGETMVDGWWLNSNRIIFLMDGCTISFSVCDNWIYDGIILDFWRAPDASSQICFLHSNSINNNSLAE